MKLFFSLSMLTGLTLATNAFAMPADFVGTWVNVNSATKGIIRAVITPDMNIRMYGASTPIPCDNGIAPITTYGRNVSDVNHRAGLAKYDFSFKEVNVALKLSGSQYLNIEHYNIF
jgi:hypothetical protein